MLYKDFFGLQKLPFNLTPDPAFLYLPQKHREALAGLTYAVMERKGFVVLTGDAGTGKTTLINSVLSRLPAGRVESSFVLNPTLSASEFLEIVMLDFDIPDVPANKAQRLWKLQEFLARVHHQDRYAVLVIDEAHKLSFELLEEIRLLGNYESASEKFLQIVLLGQPELDDILDRRDLRQLKQRIALRLYLDPLTPSEVQQYIRVRWSSAGSQETPPFSPDAVARIAQWSQGIPRLVNSLCDSALLMAYGDESPLVGSNYVRDAASNLGLIESLPQSPGPSSLPLSAYSTGAGASVVEKPEIYPKPPPAGAPAPPLAPLPGQPADPMLEGTRASAERSREQRPVAPPPPASVAEAVAKPVEPAGPRETEPALARVAAAPSIPSKQKRFPWAALAVCSVLSLLTAGVIWDHSRGKNPLNVPPTTEVPKLAAPAQAQAHPAPPPAPAAPSSPAQVKAPAPAPASAKQRPIRPPVETPAPAAPKTLRAFSASTALARGSQAQPGVQSVALPAPPPTGQTGRPGSDSAGNVPDLLQPSGAVPLPAPPSRPQPAASGPPNINDGALHPATPISRGVPELPAFARQNGLHGTVELKAAIDKQGVVTDVKVVSGNPVLAAAAKQAVLKWRYQPATRNGQPVESELAVRVAFGAVK
jgi:general secretion pathway protein A